MEKYLKTPFYHGTMILLAICQKKKGRHEEKMLPDDRTLKQDI